ncbi:hypothetical protein Pfo_016580 [Paulownia fortunei]|nr:hypothetical protein Pfo_016580 [Paulownia fortunei]
MSKSDVEMEDAEKLPNDSGNNIQESKSKVFDAKVERGEKFPCAAAVSGDVNKRENGGEDLNKRRNEDKDKTKVTEVKDQTNPKSEANKPIEGSVLEQINTKSENEELIHTKTQAEEQAAPRSAVEKQTDAKKEVIEQNATNGGLKEEKSTGNGMEGGNHVKYVEEKSNEDVAEKKPEEIRKEDADYVEHVAGGEKTMEDVDAGNYPRENRQLPTELSANEAHQGQNAELNEVPQGEDEEMEDAANCDEDKIVKDYLKEQGAETVIASRDTDGNDKTVETAAKHDGEDSLLANQHEAATPNYLVRNYPAKAGDHSGETVKTVFTQATLPLIGEDDNGTPEAQTAFMKELESFYREKAMDFKPPKFYGQPLNCLKLWRAVIRLGGYDRVTGSKLWRQVGESFHPPKTCTTVSWTFRIFYEKSLLEYERHKTQSGELQLPVATLAEASGVDGEGNGYQGSGSGRARRDAAARAMQGWHAQRLFGHGEVGEPIIKDKNLNNMAKREKNIKSIGSLKQKRPNEVEHSNKAARTETSKQLVTSVVDVGPPADWVKINVRQTKDCFEVYALVPGLLREEVRVQSDPAGRLVITGQPEQVDNPWGITAFKKVVSLPARIDPLQTSAVVSLHGRLFVRVPFEQSNI